MAYALALARHRYAQQPMDTSPTSGACSGKIGDRRLWRYWQLENAWGHLRLGSDPVPHENIMYSGFTAFQMAISGYDGDLVLHRNGCESATLFARRHRR